MGGDAMTGPGLFVGLGFRKSVSAEALTTALTAALAAALAEVGAQAGPADQARPVDGVATARAKAQTLAALLPDAPVIGVDVAGVATPTQSSAALAAYGTGSVAEAAALIAAGPGARLCQTRRIIGGVSVAIAQGETT